MTQPKPRSRRIFIADDDIDDLALYKEIFRDFTDQLLTCFTDGKHLFNALIKLPADDLPDLIVLDLNMPLWSGYKTVDAIRDIDHLKQIPIVIITTSSYDRDKLLCKQHNIPMFTKASSYKDVKKLFEQLLGLCDFPLPTVELKSRPTG